MGVVGGESRDEQRHRRRTRAKHRRFVVAAATPHQLSSDNNNNATATTTDDHGPMALRSNDSGGGSSSKQCVFREPVQWWLPRDRDDRPLDEATNLTPLLELDLVRPPCKRLELDADLILDHDVIVPFSLCLLLARW